MYPSKDFLKIDAATYGKMSFKERADHARKLGTLRISELFAPLVERTVSAAVKECEETIRKCEEHQKILKEFEDLAKEKKRMLQEAEPYEEEAAVLERELQIPESAHSNKNRPKAGLSSKRKGQKRAPIQRK